MKTFVFTAVVLGAVVALTAADRDPPLVRTEGAPPAAPVYTGLASVEGFSAVATQRVAPIPPRASPAPSRVGTPAQPAPSAGSVRSTTVLAPAIAGTRAVEVAPARTPVSGEAGFAPPVSAEALTRVVHRLCGTCHNDQLMTGNLSLEHFDVARAPENAETAERMIRKLRAGMMPPPGIPRPGGDTLVALAQTLERLIDEAAARAPHPGTRTFQRLNRAEYERLIWDLLGLQVDAAAWLPPDQISANFDNIADVQTLSPTLLDAYLNAASEVSRRAVGQLNAAPEAKTYSIPADVSQHAWERAEGAPYGTRGGISVVHTFPADGDYVFEMGFISGWGSRFQDIDVSIDGERVALLYYGGEPDFQGRRDFPIRTDTIFVRAGQRRLTAAFIRNMEGPYEDLIRPNDWSLTGTEVSYGTTSLPHMTHLTVKGPYHASGISQTPSRQRIFSCRPTRPSEEWPCAEGIIRRLAAEAYRRPLTEDDVDDLMAFYAQGREVGGFETGVRTALEAILASPHFLLRLEEVPASVEPDGVYRVSGVDLASRLSFFLWATGPDEELLQHARRGELRNEQVLEDEVRRMLADPRSEALATRFAAQWLHLQDLQKIQPDRLLYPNYDEQLADDMRRETELFFSYLVREDRSVLELFNADYTFLNERLANHYGIRGVAGEDFRRVEYPGDRRRGILGHGSILTLTSLGNRTSPVLRGKWVMKVLLGTPPPPPPPGVPDLEETAAAKDGRFLTTRERMEIHRANPVCNSCHQFMDPIGLALDNFGVTGRWRLRERGMPLDTRGVFYDGTPIASPADLSAVLLKRPIPLIRNFTENLMAYALGRRIEYFDQPTVRTIARQAKAQGYRMSSFILGVVESDAFLMKRPVPAVVAEKAAAGR